MRILVVAILAFTLSACANFSANLTKVDTAFRTYGPVIGRDIVMIADILVQAECSPLVAPVNATAANILTIVAPNSASAGHVKTVLTANAQVAAQLCPLVAAIKASVGQVPNVAPSQVVLPGA